MPVPRPHWRPKRSGVRDHLEYKIREDKGNKNRSERGGVLNIKATPRIQIGKILFFFLNQNLLNADDWFHPNWRPKQKQRGAGSRPQPSEPLMRVPTQQSSEPPSSESKPDNVHKLLHRWLITAEQQICACGRIIETDLHITPRLQWNPNIRSRPGVHSAHMHPRIQPLMNNAGRIWVAR